MGRRKRTAHTRGATSNGDDASDEGKLYTEYERAFATLTRDIGTDQPPLKRIKVRKGHQADDSEEEDPSFQPENEQHQPSKRTTRTTRQTSGLTSRNTTALAAGARVQYGDKAESEIRESEHEVGGVDIVTSKDTKGIETPGALGITWHGVSTSSGEAMGVFFAAWKRRDHDASRFAELLEFQGQQIEERDDRLLKKDIELQMKDQELHKKDEQIFAKDAKIEKLEQQIVKLQRAALDMKTSGASSEDQNGAER